MTEPKIYNLIKTECGRAKFHELASRKSLISRIRLIWFILIAIIRDFNISDSIQENSVES